MILRVFVLAAILAALGLAPAATHSNFNSPTPPVALPEPEPEALPEAAPDSLASTSSFYSFRRDLRRCASPRCGGYFVKLVNQSRTRCFNNRFASECYVAEINYAGQPDPDDHRALLRGTIRRRGQFGVFVVSEVWQVAGGNPRSDRLFRIRDRGLRCIAAPCPTHHEATLNSTASRNIAGIDLSGAGATEDELNIATRDMTSRDGILAGGTHTTVTGPAGRMQMLKVNEFYLREGGTTGGNNGGNPGQKPCMKTGCSSQVCSDQEVITTCEYRTEYDCYKRAACERQRNGECGWTVTRELSECLRRAKNN
jgi:hypothetical protein